MFNCGRVMYVCSTSKAKVAPRIIIRQYCLQWGNQKVDFGWKMLVTPLQNCFATQKKNREKHSFIISTKESRTFHPNFHLPLIATRFSLLIKVYKFRQITQTSRGILYVSSHIHIVDFCHVN